MTKCMGMQLHTLHANFHKAACPLMTDRSNKAPSDEAKLDASFLTWMLSPLIFDSMLYPPSGGDKWHDSTISNMYWIPQVWKTNSDTIWTLS